MKNYDKENRFSKYEEQLKDVCKEEFGFTWDDDDNPQMLQQDFLQGTKLNQLGMRYLLFSELNQQRDILQDQVQAREGYLQNKKGLIGLLKI
jgi:hypothetical protein